jgi:hypothetical protein
MNINNYRKSTKENENQNTEKNECLPNIKDNKCRNRKQGFAESEHVANEIQ